MNDFGNAKFEAQPELRLLRPTFVAVMFSPSKQISNTEKPVNLDIRVNRPLVTVSPSFTEWTNSCDIMHAHYSTTGQMHIFNLDYGFIFSAVLNT
jgi:hypothetical protein